jgi:multidrug resistance efflux pump
MPTLIKNKEINTLNSATSLRSSEVQEFISNKPGFTIRWGITIFFFVLVLLCLVCWFIQYPDIVNAKAILNSVNAPKEIVTKSDGKLIKILAKDNDSVTKGQVIGYMESTASNESVTKITSQLESINELIYHNRTDEIIHYFPDASNPNNVFSLGELQAPYQSFIQTFITFRDFLNSGFYLRKKAMLLTDMSNTQKLHSIFETQKDLLTQDLSLSQQTLNANDTLAAERVISRLDYRNEKSKLLSKKMTLPQINATIVTNESQQNEKKKEIADLENQIIVQKNTFIQALHTLQSQIESWEFKYLLKAPVTGKLSFTGFFQENQEIKAGQKIFYVLPSNSNYFVEMIIPQYNFGKVKAGQKVLLKFQAYPNQEYGSVEGTIEHINTLPSDSGYLAKVILPNGLITNYKKHLQYKYGLFAQAEIITQNMRLLERFYNNLSQQIKR